MPDPQEQSIFIQALERDASHRSAFLDEACASDPPLRARVERLLHHHEHAASFLASPLVGSPEPRAEADATVQQSLREGPGTVLGPYKLLEQIGEGGMGVVFLAEQTRPVRRQVALKVIKAGMDTRQVIARFEAERQALAMMDHPNIARVLDAAATDTGRPYFVMELVKGVPITRYCDEHRLTPKDRLGLFVQVCQAVQHAHQKGIIHRDLKPSNVLVALYDGKPVPKVIDFGVAKATGGWLTEHTVFTGFGAVVGTPEYMSPEQAELNQLDIDTRSDVYSLGVILYELLTGSTPLERKQLSAAAMLEVLRVVREQDPPKPSTRLSTTDQLASIAACRGLEPRKLGVVVRGELDWIVMKALEKDRARRYETANGFAKDIERYLGGEAVQAVPPSAAYRLRKFARRNKGPVVAAAVVLLTLVAGTIGTSIGLVRAQQARRAAAERAEGERLAKQAAEEREAETKAALDFVENQVFAAARPEGQDGGLGHDVTLRRALEAALPFVESSFVDRPLIEARLRMTLAHSFAQLDDYRIAAAQYEACRALYTKHRGPDHPDTLTSMDRLGTLYIRLGRRTDGIALLQETLALRKATQGAHHLDTLATMSKLADDDDTLGDADAIKLLEEVLALMKAKLPVDDRRVLGVTQTLANRYHHAGRKNDALDLREQTVAQFMAKFGPTHVLTLSATYNLAISYDVLNRRGDALRLLEEMLALASSKLGPDHALTRKSSWALALNYDALGRREDALRLREEALALARSKHGPDHALTLESMRSLAQSYAALGRQAEADTLYEQVLALVKAKSRPDHPQTLQVMYVQAVSRIRFGRGAEAVPLVDEYVRLVQGKDLDPRFATYAAHLITHRFRHYEKARDVAGCRATADMYERLNRTDPVGLYDAACWRAATAAVIRATDTSPQAARTAAAEAELAMAWLRKAVAAGFSDAAHMKGDKDLAALRDRAEFKRLLVDAANEEQVLAAARAAVRREPDNVQRGKLLKKELNSRAWRLALHPDPSRRDPARALALAEENIALPPNEAFHWNTLGVARYRAGDFDGALAALQKYREYPEDHWRWTNAFFLAMAHCRLGDKQEARRCYDRAVEMEKTAPYEKAVDLFLHRSEAAELLGVSEKEQRVSSTAPATAK